MRQVLWSAATKVFVQAIAFGQTTVSPAFEVASVKPARVPQPGSMRRDMTSSPKSASEPVLNLAAAVQQQLGLRLVPGRAKLDVPVIDKAEKTPTAN